MLIKLSQRSPLPFYQQIVEQIRALIVSGHLRPGQPLPSIRQLAAELAVSVITVKRAYLELEREGLITTRQGRGTFVSPQLPQDIKQKLLQAVREKLREGIREGFKAGLDREKLTQIFNQILEEENEGPSGD